MALRLVKNSRAGRRKRMQARLKMESLEARKLLSADGVAPTAGIPDLPGDLDQDGTVGFADFLTLSGNFGATGLTGESHLQGDLDCNGSVDFSDFLTLSGNFGQTVGAESVPEPAAVSLLGIAGLLLGLVRRRRN